MDPAVEEEVAALPALPFVQVLARALHEWVRKANVDVIQPHLRLSIEVRRTGNDVPVVPGIPNG